jgi:predicted RNA binding protein YcfA (HicA-like mRNA interferase family)
VEDQGWIQVAQRGSHWQYTHPTLAGRVTLPGDPSDDRTPFLLKSIRRQAQSGQRRA